MKYWVWLSMLNNVIPRKRSELLKHFINPENLWNASEYELRMLEPVTEEVLSDITDPEIRSRVEKTYENTVKSGIDLITIDDPQYPLMLKEIADPPVVIFIYGRADLSNQSIAVVGSRKATIYGLQAAETLSESLARHGFSIISGLARGIDSRAHTGALNANGTTIAVLGCGLDIVYPVENRELMVKIAKTGAVISEFPVGTPPIPRNFPARNRIISGLSKGTVVIEAALKSGSLITARFALEQNREVFALPGNISSINSWGTNKLIRDGARIVTSLDDIFEELRINYPKKTEMQTGNIKAQIDYRGLDDGERQLVRLLENEELHIDTLAARSGLDMKKVNSVLVMLELKGLVEQMPGKIFRVK